MTDIPILYTAPMVRALLDGRKTMTRRLAWKSEPVWNEGGVIRDGAGGQMDYVEAHIVKDGKPTLWQRVKPGDRLWVRENFTLVGGGDPGIPIYAADWREDAKARGFDNIPDKAPKWTPSIHMPRWASRLTMVVTATKIERLQKITEEDAKAEGIVEDDGDTPDIWYVPGSARVLNMEPLMADRPSKVFASLWRALHGPGSWDANPEVVALTFTVHKVNIDQLAEAA